MTWTAVSPNPAGAIHNVTSASITTHTVGNLIVLVNTLHSDTAFPTGVSSSRVTWVKVTGSDSSFSNSAISTAPAQWQGNIWLGTVNSVGTDTVTFSYTGGVTPGFTNAVMQEFTSSVGSWHVDTFTTLNSASGVAAWPSLTPAGNGELYLGFAWNQGSAVAGSTTGYVYNANADAASNGMAYNLNCASGTATAPTWGDSTETYGLIVLVAEGPGTVPSAPPLALARPPGRMSPMAFPFRSAPPLALPPSGVSFVKNTVSTFQASGTSTLAITASVTSTAGNTLVMSMEIFSYAWTSGNAVPTITSISDGTANVWHFSSSAGSQNPPTGGSFSATSGHAAIAAVAYCVNAAAVSGTVTLNLAATNSTDLEGVFAVTEFSGVQAGAVVSGASSSVFTQGDPQTTPAVSMPANSAVVAYGAKDSGNIPTVAPSFLTEFDRCGAYGVPATDQGSTGVTFTFGATTTVNGTAVLAISPPGSGTTHNGSVSLSGTGTLTAAGNTTRTRTASLSGTGTLTATGNTTRARTASLSGTGTLTATGTVVLPGAAALSGAGTLTAAGNVTRARTAALSGTGTLTATGNTTRPRTASWNGTGTLTAAGSKLVPGAGSLSGTGTLTATGNVTRARTAALSGTGTLAATANTVRARTAALSGTGTLTAAGNTTRPRTVSLSGTGTLTATGHTTRARTVALSGAGTLTATGSLSGFHQGTASLSGAGTLTATGNVTRSRTASLSGTGTLTATGNTTRARTASLSGTGTLTATEHTTRLRTVSLSGTGLLTGTGNTTRPRTASLNGTGTLTATGNTTRPRTASLSGSGTLTVTGHATRLRAVSLSGTGTLTAHRGLPHSGALQIIIPGDVFLVSGALAIVLPVPKTSLTALNGTLGALAVRLPKPATGLTGKVTHNPLRIVIARPFTTMTGKVVHNALHVVLPKPSLSLTGTVVHNGPMALQLNQRSGHAPEHPARLALEEVLRPGTTDTAVNGNGNGGAATGSPGSAGVRGSEGGAGVR